VHVLFNIFPRWDINDVLKGDLDPNGRAIVVYGVQEEDSSGDHEDEGHERHAGHGQARHDGHAHHAGDAFVVGQK